MNITSSNSTAEHSFDDLLAAVGDFLIAPDDDLPSVRCLSHEQLRNIVKHAVLKTQFNEGEEVVLARVIDRLESTNLIQPIPLDRVSDGSRNNRLFAVGLGFNAAEIHPFELLQAIVPAGVVCYMSALEFHELTTQATAHHHIARIETAPSRISRPSASVTPVRTPTNAKPRIPSLGVRQFTYRALDYYITNRDPHGLLSYQRRYLNNRSWFRVTTLEQTLLDTLHRPFSCGGPPAVFEAWDAGASKLNAEILFELLEKISNEGLTRRTGYMVDRLGDGFTKLREQIRQLLPGTANAPSSTPSLFPGLNYTNIDVQWGLAVP